MNWQCDCCKKEKDPKDLAEVFGWGVYICDDCVEDWDKKPSMAWISVEDRLPRENERVLVFCFDGICAGKLLCSQWQCDPIGSYAGDGCIFGITHWMPLPNPPEEK